MKKLIVLLALVCLSAPAFAGDSRQFQNISDSSVNFSSAETLKAANKQRKFLFIQNIGSTTVWISFTTTAAASTAGSFKLIPGASLTYENDVVPNNAISIISETSAGAVTAYEN